MFTLARYSCMASILFRCNDLQLITLCLGITGPPCPANSGSEEFGQPGQHDGRELVEECSSASSYSLVISS